MIVSGLCAVAARRSAMKGDFLRLHSSEKKTNNDMDQPPTREVLDVGGTDAVRFLRLYCETGCWPC
jgi:hypothetical protein